MWKHISGCFFEAISATGQPHYTAINKKPLRFHDEIFPHGNEGMRRGEGTDIPDKREGGGGEILHRASRTAERNAN